MNEYVIFRFNKKYVHNIFSLTEGKSLGEDTWEISIKNTDPRIEKIGLLRKQVNKKNDYLFSSFWFKRTYSKKELNAAELFKLKIKKYFEPFGEECGTIYDEKKACEICGAGRVQVSDLYLDIRKLKSKYDIMSTLADEIILSQKFVDVINLNKIKGISFKPVINKGFYLDDPISIKRYPTGKKILELAEKAKITIDSAEYTSWLNVPPIKSLLKKVQKEYEIEQEKKNKNRVVPKFYQMKVNSSPVEIVAPTKTGIDIFDLDEKGKYRCPKKHTLGLNLLSEVFVKKSDWKGEDVIETKQYIGDKRGLLRPYKIILVSPKFRDVILENKIRGLYFDVAYPV